MCRKLNNQQQLLDFLRNHFDRTGKIPSFESAAEYFEVPLAEISFYVEKLLHSRCLTNVPLLGYMLLDSDGKLYRNNPKEFFDKSHFELSLDPMIPYGASNSSVVFYLLRDFRELFKLRRGDFVIVRAIPERKPNPGDIVAVRENNFFFIKLCMYEKSGKFMPVPDYIYDPGDTGSEVIGAVSGIYRNM